MIFNRMVLGLVAAMALSVAGCAQTATLAPSSESVGGRTASPMETFPSFPDIPVAKGSQMNIDKTVVLGGEQWFGQLAIQARYNAHAMFEFYRDQLPKYGWREISAVRAPTSVLTYDRDNRVLALQITPARFGGAELTLSVAPKGQPVEPDAPPPPPPSTTGGPAPVTSLPPARTN